MLRVAVLASGRGSNFVALLEASRAAGAQFNVVGVYSDRADAGALKLAADAGLDTAHLDPRAYADRVGFDLALFERVLRVQPDLIVCAGYMRIISANALARLDVPMINIHPSLLPRYPGLNTHARALAAGDAEHGASVHVVTPELDAGPVIAQARIPIGHNDDAESLAARVLEQEHRLLPACVALYAKGQLQLDHAHVHLNGVQLSAPLQLHDGHLLLSEYT